MGGFMSYFSDSYGNKPRNIMLLGIDGAGKTTILYRLRTGRVVTTIPTMGYNDSSVTYKNLTFQVRDLGGQTSIRPYWRCYYNCTDVIIYVIDSTDKKRLGVTKKEFFCLLKENELKNVGIVILANKQDMAEALSILDITKELGLTNIKDRTYHIFKTSAITGDGLEEAMDCVSNMIKTLK